MMTRRKLSRIVRDGVLAGAAGGLAEILWVTAYAALTGSHAASLARGVTTAAGIGALLPSEPVVAGILMHMALAVALGVALALAWRTASAQLSHHINTYALVMPALLLIWALNFFVVLPIVSPAFVLLVPYPVSLMSKLLFGVAAAEVLRRVAPRSVLTPAFAKVRR